MPCAGFVRLAVDIGGTFTDLQVLDEASGATHAVKTPTTPQDPSIGLVAALREASEALSFPLAGVSALMHGTTIATNAVLQRRMARAVLVTTGGFEDVLEIGRHVRRNIYASRAEHRVLLVRRRDRFGIMERTRADGTIETPLINEELTALVAQVADVNPEAIAICLLHAYANPAHELQLAAGFAAALPTVPVSLSHQICPEIREFERSSTTVLNAMLIPVVSRYLQDLAASVGSLGLAAPVYLIQSNGGAARPETAADQPARLLLSGPSGGALAAETLSRDLGEPNLIGVDMGGTSCDVSLVVGGAVRKVSEGAVDGCPVRLPMVEIRTVGAGGGSIAVVESNGRMRVGPLSAGSVPGPACYGHGGTRPTVTDANVALGRIDPQFFLGGGMPLDRQAACSAIRDSVARPLDLSVDAAADGILRVAVATMAAAIRLSLFEKGLDPRDFALVPFGGAGGLHACETADELGTTRVVFPRDPGTLSAHGMLSSDLVHDLARSRLMPADRTSLAMLRPMTDGLLQTGTEMLDRDGIAPTQRVLQLSLDLRYPGQGYEINTPLTGPDAIEDAATAFHRLHQAQYAHCEPDVTPEIITVRCTATGRLAKPRRPALPASVKPEASRSRPVCIAGNWHPVPVLERASIGPVTAQDGPAIIEEPHATLYLAPGWRMAVVASGDLHAERRRGD